MCNVLKHCVPVECNRFLVQMGEQIATAYNWFNLIDVFNSIFFLYSVSKEVKIVN